MVDGLGFKLGFGFVKPLIVGRKAGGDTDENPMYDIQTMK